MLLHMHVLESGETSYEPAGGIVIAWFACPKKWCSMLLTHHTIQEQETKNSDSMQYFGLNDP